MDLCEKVILFLSKLLGGVWVDKVVSAKDLLKNSNEYYEELSRKRKKFLTYYLKKV